MEMHGVKKPNDMPENVPRRSVGYYKKNREKLERAIERGYLGKQRIKFLKEIIHMNSIMCDEIRECAEPAYLLYRA